MTTQNPYLDALLNAELCGDDVSFANIESIVGEAKVSLCALEVMFESFFEGRSKDANGWLNVRFDDEDRELLFWTIKVASTRVNLVHHAYQIALLAESKQEEARLRACAEGVSDGC